MTMSPTDTAKRTQTPPLQGRGKGWGIDADRRAELSQRAREMRNNPTEPEKRLWRALSGKQLSGYKFRRQQVIGHAIVDFLCPARGLVVEVDGDTHADPAKDARRDAGLRARGLRVLRVSNADVMQNIEGVLQHILTVLEEVDRPHPDPSPEGEGLDEAISLEGSVG